MNTSHSFTLANVTPATRNVLPALEKAGSEQGGYGTDPKLHLDPTSLAAHTAGGKILAADATSSPKVPSRFRTLSFMGSRIFLGSHGDIIKHEERRENCSQDVEKSSPKSVVFHFDFTTRKSFWHKEK